MSAKETWKEKQIKANGKPAILMVFGSAIMVSLISLAKTAMEMNLLIAASMLFGFLAIYCMID